MHHLTEKIAEVVKAANKDVLIRQEILKDPLAYLLSQGINLPKNNSVDAQYYVDYGLFLALDTRGFSGDTPQPPGSPDKNINDDHFRECLHY